MNQYSKAPNILLTLAFVADLLTPFLIWQGIVPGILRWISHGAIFIMILAVMMRMLAFKRIPFTFWIIFLLSVIGIATAMLTGQGVQPTIWGWWLMYQFPLVCLFCYLQPTWPKKFAGGFLTAMIVVVGLEVLVQLFQYLTGEIPGDNLAGTFGENGTGNLVLFLVIVLCFCLGDWLENRRWINLAIILIFGVISSVLGEMKLFYMAVFILGFMTIFFFALKGKHLWTFIPYSFLLMTVMIIFIPVYNAVVPSAREIPLERYFYDPQLLTKYLNLANRVPTGSVVFYDLGRNYAASYAWDQISTDPQTMILGYGLGARSESKTLGILGRALIEGNLGATSGTSLLVLLQETGLSGMFVFAIFILIVIVKLFLDIRSYPGSDINGLRYGLILFTIFWPVWIWYNAAWSLRVPMLIYWAILGFVFGKLEYYPFIGSFSRKAINRQQTDS